MNPFRNILNIFSKNKIVASIGENNVSISIHKNLKVVETLFIDNLTEANFSKVSTFFKKYKKEPIYILLDTVAQNYNLKSFPSVSYIDIIQMVKRTLRKDKPANTVARYYYIDRDKISKKWNYMFVFAALESPLSEWLDYFYTIPNRVVGVYMIPIELQGIVKILKKKQKTKVTKVKQKKFLSPGRKKTPTEKKDIWELLILQNEVSGLREAAFKNGKLIFTRLLNNNSALPNFILKFKDDLLKTIEYLKRLEPNIKLSELSVYTVLDQKGKGLLDNLQNTEYNISNYTPNSLSIKLGLKSFLKNSELCDELTKISFIKKTRKLKFQTIKLSLINRVFITKNIFKRLSILSLIIILSLGIIISLRKYTTSKKLREISEVITVKRTVLNTKKTQQFGLKEQNLKEIEDISSLYEVITHNVADPHLFTEKIISLQKKHNIESKKIEWKMSGYNFSQKNLNTKNYFSLEGEIKNPDGNVETLFRNFDTTIADAKKIFPGYVVNNSKLPQDIDFNRAYYEVDFNLKLEGDIQSINPYGVDMKTNE